MASVSLLATRSHASFQVPNIIVRKYYHLLAGKEQPIEFAFGLFWTATCVGLIRVCVYVVFVYCQNVFAILFSPFSSGYVRSGLCAAAAICSSLLWRRRGGVDFVGTCEVRVYCIYAMYQYMSAVT